MPDNSTALESTIAGANADRGYWRDMPIPLTCFTANSTTGDTLANAITAGAVGLANTNLADTTATGYVQVLRLGLTGGTLATNVARYVAPLCLPLLVGGAPQLLQALNSASAGFGPAVEVQVLCRNASATAAAGGVKAYATYFSGYASTTGAVAAWASLTGTTTATAIPGTAAVSDAANDPTTFRWATIPLMRPDIASVSPNTAAQRDAVNLGLRNNNYPLLFNLALTNAHTIADGDRFEIAAVNLRFKVHAANRFGERGEGFSNGGIIGVASGISPTFPRPAFGATPVVF